MDISYELEDGIFNYRVAAIIKHNDKYLVLPHYDKNYVSLIGGRVKFNEPSNVALKREILEETGEDVGINRLFGIFENFFKRHNQNYHEILVIYEVSFVNKKVYLKDEIINKDDNNNFVWMSTDELIKNNLEPKFVLEHINDKEVFHFINREVK